MRIGLGLRWDIGRVMVRVIKIGFWVEFSLENRIIFEVFLEGVWCSIWI